MNGKNLAWYIRKERRREETIAKNRERAGNEDKEKPKSKQKSRTLSA